MSAFISWLMSSEPCTPPQSVAVCAAVFGGMLLEMVLIARICARAKNN